ncbi:MAG: AAA family ATPase [Candidatus Micrarchaeaceae archaeon]
MYRLNSIAIKNFTVINDLQLNLDSMPGTYIITGANGAGKSSLLQAILWGLFGVTFRDIEGDLTIPTVVSLRLTDGENIIDIARTKLNGKTKTEVKINNQLQTYGKMKDMQVVINRLILNSDKANLYLNSSFYSSYTQTDFINQTTADKIKTMEELLQISILNELYEKVKDKINDINIDIAKIETEKTMVEQQIDKIKQEIKKFSQSNTNIIESVIGKFKAQQDLNNKMIAELNEKIEKLKLQMNAQQKTIESNNDIDNLNTQLQHLDILHRSKKWLQKQLLDAKDVCPVCGNKLSEEIKQKRSAEFQSEITAIEQKLNAVKKSVESSMKIITTAKQNLEKLKNEIIGLENKRLYLIKENESYVVHVNDLNDEVKLKYEQIKNELTEMENKLNAINNAANDAIESLNIHKYLKDILSPHSSMRVLYLQQYLDALADQTLHFLQSYFKDVLDFQIIYDRAKITLRLNQQNVDNLSEGEKNSVRISFILSTISMLYNMHVNLGLLFFDEVFSSFDDTNINSTIQLLNDFAVNNGVQIFVVHHGQIDYNLFDKHITVIRTNNHSEIQWG